MKKNKKGKTLALSCIFALVAVLAATFAWFTSTDEKTNHFEGAVASGKDIEIVETFTPPTNWEPGSEVNKDVAIANIGEKDVIIRVSFEESLQLLQNNQPKDAGANELNNKTKEQVYVLPGKDSNYANTSVFSGTAPTYVITGGDYAGTYNLVVKERASVDDKGVTSYSYRSYFQKQNTTEIYYASGIDGVTRDSTGKISVNGTPTLSYIDLTYKAAQTGTWYGVPVHDPKLTAVTGDNFTGESVIDSVIQILFNNVKATPTENFWYFNQVDGYFYYIGIVKPGSNTAQLVDSVTLLGSAKNEYSKLKYDLTVKAEGISAFKSAVDQWVPTGTNTVLSTALKNILPEK